MTGYLASVDIDLISERDKLTELARERDIDIDDAIVEIVNAALKRPPAYDYAVAPVRITRDAVFIGDEQIPGAIAQDGIVLKPGGAHEINRLTITFLVGHVTADDPWVTATKEVAPVGPADPAIRYRSRQPADGQAGA